MTKKTFRIMLYVFDLLMFLAFFACLRHCMWFESDWQLISMHILLFLRLIVPFLMYFRVKWAIIPHVVATALYIPFIGNNAFKNMICNMGLFPSVVLHRPELLQGENYFFDMTNGEFLVWVIICWVWLAPFIILCIDFCVRCFTQRYSESVSVKILRKDKV